VHEVVDEAQNTLNVLVRAVERARTWLTLGTKSRCTALVASRTRDLEIFRTSDSFQPAHMCNHSLLYVLCGLPFKTTSHLTINLGKGLCPPKIMCSPKKCAHSFKVGLAYNLILEQLLIWPSLSGDLQTPFEPFTAA
jgi:hypothetical protein